MQFITHRLSEADVRNHSPRWSGGPTRAPRSRLPDGGGTLLYKFLVAYPWCVCSGQGRTCFKGKIPGPRERPQIDSEIIMQQEEQAEAKCTLIMAV